MSRPGKGTEEDEFGRFVADLSTVVAAAVESSAARPEAAVDAEWFLDRARFAWGWVSIEERIVEEER